MDQFKIDICNALVKHRLTLIDNCFDSKRNYNFEKFIMKKTQSQWAGTGAMIMLESLEDQTRHAGWHLAQRKRPFEITERLPCPRFWLKVLIYVKRKIPTSLARRGWLGIIFLITPVFRIWKKCVYIVSKVCPKAYCVRWRHYFRHPPSKGL